MFPRVWRLNRKAAETITVRLKNASVSDLGSVPAAPLSLTADLNDQTASAAGDFAEMHFVPVDQMCER